MTSKSSVLQSIKEHSHLLNTKEKNIGLVMAGGHGKRIKSSLPKVAHLVWGRPSVLRVLDAVKDGLKTNNQVIVVGRQAEHVITMIGSQKGRVFALQKEQLGTGHAVQQGLKTIPKSFTGNLYILPGDAGAIDGPTLTFFKKEFEKSHYDMMMLTGQHEGSIESNYYGRIVRVPSLDVDGRLVPTEDQGQVIAIVQHQDILSMKPGEKRFFQHHGRRYKFFKEELLNMREFDAIIFAIRFPSLLKYIHRISPQNIQKEFYLTDLVELFNKDHLLVGSVTPPNYQDVLLGFNDKTVLRKIENIYRLRCFEKIKNIIDVEDNRNFFMDDNIIRQLLRKEKKDGPLDIFIGNGVYLQGNITLSKGVSLGQNTRIEGNVVLEKGVKIGNHVQISNFEKQKIIIKKNSQIQGYNIIKGNVIIHFNTQIGEAVNITGNNEFPTVIGAKSRIFGSSYLFGCQLNPYSHVESSILIKKKVNCVSGKKTIQVRFVIPTPQGENAVSDL